MANSLCSEMVSFAAIFDHLTGNIQSRSVVVCSSFALELLQKVIFPSTTHTLLGLLEESCAEEVVLLEIGLI